MRIDVVTLGPGRLDEKTGTVLVQASQPVSGDDDAEPFADAPMITALGLQAVPYPAGPDGHCEGLLVGGIGGLDGCIVGAREVRTAGAAGNLKPGDVVLGTTGPNQAAQLQLKEDKRQAVLVVKKANGEQMLQSLDANAETYTLAVNGAVVNIDKDGDIALVSASGKAGITISDSVVHIMGKIVLGGAVPNPAMSIMLGPVTGSPGGGAAAPMVAAPGVFIGM